MPFKQLLRCREVGLERGVGWWTAESDKGSGAQKRDLLRTRVLGAEDNIGDSRYVLYIYLFFHVKKAWIPWAINLPIIGITAAHALRLRPTPLTSDIHPTHFSSILLFTLTTQLLHPASFGNDSIKTSHDLPALHCAKSCVLRSSSSGNCSMR